MMRALPAPVLVAVLMFTGPAAVFPVVPHQALALGARADVVAFLLMADVAATCLAAPFAGWLGDRFGHRPTILACLALCPPAFWLLAEADGIGLMVASRLLMGAGLAARSALQAYGTSSSGAETRILGLAGINGAYGLAFIIGPAIAIIALDASEANYRLIAWIACGLSVSAFLLAMLLLKPQAVSVSSKPEPQGTPAVASWPPRPVGMAAVGLQAVLSFVFATMAATVGVWSAQVLAWDARHLALAFACAGIAAVATQFGAAQGLIRRFGDHAAAAFSGGLMVAGLILLVLWPRAEATLAAMALLGAGSATALTSLQYLSSRMNRRRAQGTLFGLSLSLNSAARVLGPIWGGFSLVHMGLSAPYISGAILALVASLTVIHLARGSEEQYP